MDNLLTKYSTEEIECAIIQRFVTSKNIKIKNNLVLLDILNKNSKNIEEIKKVVQTPASFDDLVSAFELLIPRDDRKLNGAFFTPSLITNYMVDGLLLSSDTKICDPSCGCGAFLVAICEKFKKKFNKSIKDTIENNIYGVDILDYGVRRCKLLLSLMSVVNGEDKKDFHFNIHVADSLTTNWEKLFPTVLKNGGFDAVIGNPPYVKYQDLPTKLRKNLYNNWVTLKKGTYNLYFAFFELGLSIMKNSGQLAYIVPNNYFTSLAGFHLRNYLQNNKLIEKIIDFNHLKIFKVQTYTCITFLSKKSHDDFLYERVDTYPAPMTLKNLQFSTIKYDDLNAKKWRLLRSGDRLNIKKIENQPNQLGGIVDIRVGIATCKDNVYFIDGTKFKDGLYQKSYRGKTYFIEKNIVRPVAKISDFENQNDLENNSRMIIFPYIVNGAVNIIPEKDLAKNFPKCYEYLLAAKSELETRDKGNGEYPVWYAYARTQGLNFTGMKLLTPTFSDHPRFLLDNKGSVLFCNGYGIYEKNSIQLLFNQSMNLEVLKKILNSKVMEYYISKTSFTIEGGYPCYQKNFIELFGIPDFTEKELSYLENEGAQKKVDNFLIKKYELSLLS